MRVLATFVRRSNLNFRYFCDASSANDPKRPSGPRGSFKMAFSDPKVAFASKSNGELFRAWLILYACSFKSLVKRSDSLYKLSLLLLGDKLTHRLVDATLFRHFCAGVDHRDIVGPIKRLERFGVGGILDFAAEAKDEEPPDTGGVDEGKLPLKSTAQARVHAYAGETRCDDNAEIFKHAVEAVHDVAHNGFAAIKLSGLGQPALMERMSVALLEIEALFGQLGHSKDASTVELNYEQFLEGWKQCFNFLSEAEVKEAFDRVDTDQDGYIDIVDWMSSLTVLDLPRLVAACKDQSSALFRAALNEDEMIMMKNLIARCEDICALASKLNVRVMIDAEWTAIQPAIDSIVLALQRKHNTGRDNAIVFGTHQMYLHGSKERLVRSLERSKRENWKFGAKLVRGAYMVSERERAVRLGVASPVLPTYQNTERNYHAGLKILLQDGNSEVMVATHSEASVQFVLAELQRLQRDGRRNVFFGQLLGMADHVTFTLAANKFMAYKYIPYGPVDEVMPYLLRRTQENSTLLGSPAVVKERKMLFSELKRRLF